MERRSHQEKRQEFGLPDIGIPAEVLFNPELTHLQKLLFGFIRNLSHSAKGCFASNRYLGKLLGVGPQTISNAIARLREYHYIKINIETRQDGTEQRQIYINSNFPAIYKNYIIGVYKILNTPPLKTLYPPIKEFIIEEVNINSYINNNNIVGADTPTVNNKNERYKPLAQKLGEIVRSQRNIKHTGQQLASWADEFRKLHDMNEVKLGRMRRALDWLANHYEETGDPIYCPVIQSGASFRNKFTKLENAMQRQKDVISGKRTNGPNVYRNRVENKYSF